ncbi:uncharacterized protein THITE_2123386 [Thermothielavioides terrestris NRRL 8126]|uniref:Transmembrane protein n=1 Tax=Thermothielavioides terrestris (strain ATCC 38088 / NRRL 8126) TaxID=578455 RepID=G2RHA4_THETT|nr:uncharacterized protein THITE_2123386 [Thermothielavioides terrestris NRRL 8126]AEO71216.1 hypothetical protein THITE_2123386 [Thermothielavioides terrestris NRRL 8126]
MEPHQSTGNDAMDPHNGREESQAYSSSPVFFPTPNNKIRPTSDEEIAADVSNLQPPESTETPRPNSTPISNKDAEMEAAREVTLEMLHDLGGDDFGAFFFLGLFAIFLVSAVGFFLLSWSWITAIIGVFIGFVVVSPTCPLVLTVFPPFPIDL